MKPLAQGARRLIVECGLAAVNHGLTHHAWTIHAALPELVTDPAARRLLEAMMMIGLGRDGSAARLLEGTPGPEGALLRQLIGTASDDSSSLFLSDLTRSIHGHHRHRTHDAGTASATETERHAD
jgi:type III secretion system SsaH family protein